MSSDEESGSEDSEQEESEEESEEENQDSEENQNSSEEASESQSQSQEDSEEQSENSDSESDSRSRNRQKNKGKQKKDQLKKDFKQKEDILNTSRTGKTSLSTIPAQLQFLQEASPQYKPVLSSGLSAIKEIAYEMEQLELNLSQKMRFFNNNSFSKYPINSFQKQESPIQSFQYENKGKILPNFEYYTPNLNYYQQKQDLSNQDQLETYNYRNLLQKQSELQPINQPNLPAFKLDLDSLPQIQSPKQQHETYKSDIGVNTELIQENVYSNLEELQKKGSPVGQSYRQEISNYPIARKQKQQIKPIFEEQGTSIKQLYKHTLGHSQISRGRSMVSEQNKSNLQRSKSPTNIQKAINVLLEQDDEQFQISVK